MQALPAPPSSTVVAKPLHWLGQLRFQVKDSVVVLQPKREGLKDRVPTLHIDLRSGRIHVQAIPLLPEDCPTVIGVVGVLKLEEGYVLAVVTRAKRVRDAWHAMQATCMECMPHGHPGWLWHGMMHGVHERTYMIMLLSSDSGFLGCCYI